jgi:hypothetical protein
MKSIFTTRFAGILILVALLLAGAILPGFAQDSTTTVSVDSLTIVTGAVEYSPSGDILVAGVTIAPAGAFDPSMLHEGDIVIITGISINDTTLQAVTFEFFDDSQQDVEVTPEVTLEATDEVTPEATVEATDEATPEATAEASTEATDCNGPNQPVAMRIAETFDVTYDEVMALHCQGIGFGNIIRAYVLAENSDDGSTAQDFLDRHGNGEGWGQIMHDSGVKPSDLAPGQVLKHHDDQQTGDTSQPTNGNGNGHGNGGNGNGHGNGNGNGNGGNGHGGGNGNGNGGGNGHGHGG